MGRLSLVRARPLKLTAAAWRPHLPDWPDCTRTTWLCRCDRLVRSSAAAVTPAEGDSVCTREDSGAWQVPRGRPSAQRAAGICTMEARCAAAAGPPPGQRRWGSPAAARTPRSSCRQSWGLPAASSCAMRTTSAPGGSRGVPQPSDSPLPAAWPAQSSLRRHGHAGRMAAPGAGTRCSGCSAPVPD